VPLPDPPLLVISDRSQAKRPLIKVAEAAFAGGCRWFSLREKDLPAEERRALLAELFDQEKDPVQIIKWKEVIETLEFAADKCEDVANVIEGVTLKNA